MPVQAHLSQPVRKGPNVFYVEQVPVSTLSQPSSQSNSLEIDKDSFCYKKECILCGG